MLSSPKLIGLNGKARSGKDTTADMIGGWCGVNEFTVAKRGFADKLKISAARALGVMDGEIDTCNDLKRDGTIIQIRKSTAVSGPKTLVHELTGRQYLQFYGTEAHRDVFGSDFWVDAVLPKTEGKQTISFESPDGTTGGNISIPDWYESFLIEKFVADFCLVTDVRFENEARRIRELGGEVWKIVRDGSGAGEHASEMELPGEYINVTIDNNGTYNDLQASVDVLMADVSQLAAIANG